MPQRLPAAATAVLQIVAAVALSLLTAGPAAAAEIASSVAGFTGGPALGAGGRVVVGERLGGGSVRVVSIDPVTRARTPLATFPGSADPAIFGVLDISGTGATVTASLLSYNEKRYPNLSSSAIVALSPSFAVLGSCPAPGGFGPHIEAAGGDGFAASIRSDCGAGPSSVRVQSAGGVLTIPMAVEPRDRTIAPLMVGLRANGPMLAYNEIHYPGGMLASSAVVARAATGEVLMRVVPPSGTPGELGLGSDGSLVMPASGCKLVAALAPSSSLYNAPVPRDLCPAPAPALYANPTTIAVAGGRVVYSTGSRYVVTDLHGDTHALPGAMWRRYATSSVAFDGHTAYVVRHDCDADRLLAIGVDDRAPLPDVAATCPVRRAGPSRLRVQTDGRVRIALRCPHGCRGVLRLVQQRHGRRERPVASVPYASAAGSLVLRPRIARYARALAGCSGGMRLSAILHPVGDTPVRGLGKGLGAYRIVSRSRCRRGGGPPFTGRQPGPRP